MVQIENAYELNGETPHSLTYGSDMLFIGFDQGIVRAFDPKTIEMRTRLCLPHYLQVDVASETVQTVNTIEAFDGHK